MSENVPFSVPFSDQKSERYQKSDKCQNSVLFCVHMYFSDKVQKYNVVVCSQKNLSIAASLVKKIKDTFGISMAKFEKNKKYYFSKMAHN